MLGALVELCCAQSVYHVLVFCLRASLHVTLQQLHHFRVFELRRVIQGGTLPSEIWLFGLNKYIEATSFMI